MPYDDDNQVDDSGPSIGQVNEANKRKNARRGGTPNAPAVDDEPAPQGVTAVDGAAPPQSIASYDPETGAMQEGQRTIAPIAAGIAGAATAVARRVGAGAQSLASTVGENTGTGYVAPTDPVRMANEGGADRGYPPQPPTTSNPIAVPASIADYGDQPGRAGLRGPEPAQGSGIAAPAPAPVPGAITRAGNAFSGTGVATLNPGGMTDDQRNNAPFALANQQASQRIATLRAQDAAGIQSKNQAMNSNADWADAWLRNRDAESNNRVARFRATDGADMILGGGIAGGSGRGTEGRGRGYGGIDEQQQAILDEANSAGNELAAARAGLVKAGGAVGSAGARDPLADLKSTTESNDRADLTNLRMAQGEQGIAQQNVLGPLAAEHLKTANALEKMNVEGQQRITDLGKKLMVASSQKDVDLLSRQIAGLLGKEKPAQYSGHVVHGQETTDPLTGTKTREADRFMLIGPNGAEEVPLQAKAGAGPKQPVADVHAAAKEAVGRGAPLAAVNAKLKSEGYPPLP